MIDLVTGAAGFIGSQVASHLLDQGSSVVGIDNLNDHYDRTLKEWRAKRLRRRDGFHLRKADITDEKELSNIFQELDIDRIFNLAAHAGVRQSLQDPYRYYQVNSQGALNLLEECRQHDIGTFLLASTSSLYGHDNDVPFSEDANTDVPPSPYSASKKAAEATTATYSELYGINCPVVRYFTVYGPAGRPDMSVFRFIRWIAESEPITIYGDGTQERDFTYVEDIARGTWLAAEKVEGFEVINLGNDDPVPIIDLIGVIEESIGREACLRHVEGHPADMDATWADIGKARDLLDWEPQVALPEGIRRTAEWYETQEEWVRNVDLGEV